ncbi:hypothetical protein J1N35_018754 [Gossypium stocksii]|uniref:Putative plant transposon protein domain-containing protein n=1 Tax=Gossypium stocksii TaxID=47602 RepID=A0A9D3VQX9_9ROSI|nr:hypothetical protein J1N35_018754 [Gossypium stocksii]
MPRKRTCASAQIDETQSKFHCVEAKVRYESIYKNKQMHTEKGFTLKESNYRDFMARIRQIAEALNWELFCEKRPSVDEELVREFYANLTSREMTEVPVRGIKVPINSNAINEFFELPDFENDEYSSLMSNIKPKFLLLPSSHGTTISLERMVLLYSILTGKTIDVGKIILKEIRNCVTRRFGPDFPFTITIMCLKAEILANVKKTGYIQGTITDWDLYRVAGDSVLQQQVEESEEPEDPEEEEDPSMQSFEVPNKADQVEPKDESDAGTPMYRTQSPSPDFQDELSNLMDFMQHMQWQQQAYWRYSKMRDDSFRSAFQRIYNDPFIFVPEFPDFIFEPWTPLSKKELGDSCKGDNDGAKDESKMEGSANK